ncbi:MAG: phage portal protein [Cellulomonadaceae bacterium]|nr:phage portal protein [Cellulomonadaceae bacterium]
MGRIHAVADWLGLTRAGTDAATINREDTGTGVTPPSRNGGTQAVSPSRALTISQVYRAVQIHAVAASQLSLDVRRRGTLVPSPLLIRKPEADRSRSATIEYLVTSLALTGNAYLRLLRMDPTDPASPVQSVAALNPNGVVIWDDPTTGRLRYSYNDDLGRHRMFEAWEVAHLPFLRIPGTRYGLGPLQAAQVELGGALDLRDYSAGWFADGGVPTGVLATEQTLTKDQAAQYKALWNETAGGTRITGAGLKYSPILISPKDAQFLESQQFTVTQMARLLGVPASLMLATVEGNSQSYANVEQDWIGYVRFSLMAYLREIEEAFTDILPNGQEARFNVEALLRTDTKTRYEGHEIALRAGWTDVSEVRAIEGLPPRTDLPATPANPAPVSSDTPTPEA